MRLEKQAGWAGWVGKGGYRNYLYVGCYSFFIRLKVLKLLSLSESTKTGEKVPNMHTHVY